MWGSTPVNVATFALIFPAVWFIFLYLNQQTYLAFFLVNVEVVHYHGDASPPAPY